MFYLIEFLKVFRDNKLLSVIFLASSMFFISGSHLNHKLTKELSFEEGNTTNPYFNALVSHDIKLDSVIRRMNQLPGVFEIVQDSKNGIGKEIQNLQAQYGESIVKNLSAFTYKKIQVQLEPNLKNKSKKLIKEYLSRLVGQKNVTIGGIKTPRKINIKKDKLIFNISSWGAWYFIAIAGVVNIVSIFLLMKPLYRTAYIIEKFQRSRGVYIKTVMTGTAAIFSVIYLMSYVVKPHFEVVTVLLMMTVVFVILSLLAITQRLYKV